MSGRYGRTGRFGVSIERYGAEGTGLGCGRYSTEILYGWWIRGRSVHIIGPSIENRVGANDDSHDIIHLLTDLPTASTSTSRGAPSPTPSSSSSWASLPSDLEETFHLSDPAEIEEYERVKRIKRIEMLREARLREREEEDKGLEDVDGKGKGKALWPENEIVRSPIRSVHILLISEEDPVSSYME